MDRDELIARSRQIYESQLRAELERTHLNSFVVIEPQSGEYFLGDTLSEAAAAARAAHPDRRGYGMRVGHSAAIHLGANGL